MTDKDLIERFWRLYPSNTTVWAVSCGVSVGRWSAHIERGGRNYYGFGETQAAAIQSAMISAGVFLGMAQPEPTVERTKR